MQTRSLLALFAALAVLTITTAPSAHANDTFDVEACFSIPSYVECGEGTLVSDVTEDNCRTITCSTSGNEYSITTCLGEPEDEEPVNDTPANGACFTSISDVPVSCTGGTVMSDTDMGSCRSVTCTNGANTLQVLGCDKPDGAAATHFELYRQSAAAGISICFADTCISSDGYARGDFPACVDDTEGSDEEENGDETGGDDTEGEGEGDVCIAGNFRTQTPGGWGAPANGNNPGAYRDANFAAAFPDGIRIGTETGMSAQFTSAAAVEAFLPSGGKPSALSTDYTNPTSALGSFAGHVLALTLTVGFDAHSESFSEASVDLGDVVIDSSKSVCNGMTVGAVLSMANQALAGHTTSLSLKQLHDCVSAINENNVDGTRDNGFLNDAVCEEDEEIVICHEGETITINEDDWEQHENHDDALGACTADEEIIICHDGETRTIDEDDWEQHEDHGDTLGVCPAPDPVCGNGILEQGEECDGSAPTGFICTSTCHLVPQQPPADITCEEALALGLLSGEITGSTATVTNNANASFVVSLAIYEMIAATVDGQVLFDSESTTVAAGSTASLSVDVPVCTYQLDLVCGEPLSTNPEYGARIIDFSFGNTQSNFCVPESSESVELSVAEWYPQGSNYVFICDAGFAATEYDWFFGDGHVQLNSQHGNVYHSYAVAGDYTVSCTAMNAVNSGSDSMQVTVES